MFQRLKRLIRVALGEPSFSVSEGFVVIEEHAAAIEELTRDLADVHTALQRIERKQLRWLEMFNKWGGAKDLVLEDNGEGKPAIATVTAHVPASGLTPGQIVS